MRTLRTIALGIGTLTAIAVAVTLAYRMTHPQWIEFNRGERSFFAGDFSSAIPRYTNAITQGLRVPKVYLRLGDSYLATERFREAVLVYEQMLQTLPPQTTAVENLARLYDQLSGADRAIELYKRYESQLSYDSRGMLHLAMLYKRRSEFDLATPLFQKVLSDEPRNTLAQLSFAEMLSWMKRFKESLELYRKVSETVPADRLVLAHFAQAELWSGDATTAAQLYRRAIAAERPAKRSLSREALGNDIPDQQLHWELARALGAAKRYDESFAEYGTLLREHPTLYEAKVEAATILSWQGKKKESLELLGEIPPEQARDKVLVFLAEYFATQRNFETSEKLFLQYLERFPNDKETRLKYAQMLGWAKQHERSREEYNAIRELGPEPWMAKAIDERLVLLMADLHAERKEFDESSELYEVYLGYFPEDRDARLAYVRMLVAAEKYSQAIQQLNIRIDRHPDDVEALLERARALGYSKLFEQSIDAYRKLLAANIEVNLVKKELAEVLYWDGQFEESLVAIESIPPEARDGETSILLADLYVGKKNLEKAGTLYREYLAVHPDDFGTRFKYAELLGWSKQFPTAISEFEKLLRSRPEDVQLRRRYAQILTWAGRNGDALRELDLAQRKSGTAGRPAGKPSTADRNKR